MSTPYSVWRQYFVPQHGLSRFAGFLANQTNPSLKNYLIRYFLNRYSVNLEDALIEDPFAYKSFNDFFTRKLKPNARPLPVNPNYLVSPADGSLYQCGKITNDTLLHAKNHQYTIAQLLGCKDSYAEQFIDGHYYCIYLAPHNYHRVHMPASGQLQHMRYIPGRLFSVNQLTAEWIDQLFARNERMVSFFKGDCGLFSVILVGAMLVGGIHTSWAGQIKPDANGLLERDYQQHSIKLNRGDEAGHFSMGSTVILLFDKNTKIDQRIQDGCGLQVGEPIGQF